MTNRTIKTMCSAIGFLHVIGDESKEIKGIAIDSREVKSSYVFIAIIGTEVDGNAYVAQAVNNGATVVVSENAPDLTDLPEAVAWVQVADARKAASSISEWFYGYPSRQLKLIGVTGTNGKSSVVYMLHQLFGYLGYRAGMFSTIINKSHTTELPARLTTPDPVSLSKGLAEMVDQGCDYVFMEVSSHALDQKRVEALDFDGAVFTNITHDHLDYHLTFKNYRDAKKSFFDRLKSDAFALVNEDDRNGMFMIQNTQARTQTFGLRSMADYTCQILEMDLIAMTIHLDGQDVLTRITGRFNAYNLLAVYGVADLCGMNKVEVLQGLSMLQEAPGRFQRVKLPVEIEAEAPVGIVDYAHTPDAVEKVTQAAQDIIEHNGRVIIALGCGGNRDRDKRPAMGRAAAQNADIAVFTSDNPRNENPQQIIDEMYDSLDAPLKAKVFKIVDRREAIRLAVSLARAGDVVIVAGKGHEQYQEIDGVKNPFDDRVELKKALTQKIKW